MNRINVMDNNQIDCCNESDLVESSEDEWIKLLKITIYARAPTLPLLFKSFQKVFLKKTQFLIVTESHFYYVTLT